MLVRTCYGQEISLVSIQLVCLSLVVEYIKVFYGGLGIYYQGGPRFKGDLKFKEGGYDKGQYSGQKSLFLPQPKNSGKANFFPVFRDARNNRIFQKMVIKMKKMAHSAKFLGFQTRNCLKLLKNCPKFPTNACENSFFSP